MMIHAKSDSDDATSLTSSTPISPKRPVYYVQSPSRDSHDDDKSSSTPASFNSPLESPSHSSYARHSRSSSSSRVSSHTPGRKGGGRTKRFDKECNVIEEEEMFYYTNNNYNSRRFQVLIRVLVLVSIFFVICLIMWGVSRPFKPQITVKSLKIHNFYFGQGSDWTGVPTKMSTMNCSLHIKIYNPATFFGIHVSLAPANLAYSEIIIATGELKKYYLSRKSGRTAYVNLQGVKVPLYGAGVSLANPVNRRGIPLTLALDVRSRGNVVGKLVKSRHERHVSCSLIVDSRRGNKPVLFKKDSCVYE